MSDDSVSDNLKPAPKKRGRPSAGPRTSTAIRLTDELHERLRVAADERDLSMNWLVNRAVTYYLDRLIPVDELKITRD